MMPIHGANGAPSGHVVQSILADYPWTALADHPWTAMDGCGTCDGSDMRPTPIRYAVMLSDLLQAPLQFWLGLDLRSHSALVSPSTLPSTPPWQLGCQGELGWV